MAVPDPGVEFFVSFHDITPNEQGKCIYFVKSLREDRRCKFYRSDNKRAIELHRNIIESESANVPVEDIQEYIRSNCCAKAGHRDLVLSSPLLIPLVVRWLDEIMMQKSLEDASRPSAQDTTLILAKRTLRAESVVPSSCRTSTLSPINSATTVKTPLSSPSSTLFDGPDASIVRPNPLQRDASSSSLPHVPSTTTPSTTSPISEPSGAQKRYNLRSSAIDDSLAQLRSQAERFLLAEFHPHIKEPTSEDTVAWRFCADLSKGDNRRDFQTGSVYIYNRESSPGYVKIGWTSRSVNTRLAEWSECGYKPNEVFRVTGVPHAQRVETLTHFELIKEWRRERPCRGCLEKGKGEIRHQEWFEVSPERAEQVVSMWAQLFMESDPYELNGSLKDDWKNVIDVMKLDGEAITSKRLLEHYKTTAAKDTALAETTRSTKEATAAKEAAMPAIVKDLPKPSPSPNSGEQSLFPICKVEQGEEKPQAISIKGTMCASLERVKTNPSQGELSPSSVPIADIVKIEAEEQLVYTH
ncbi:T5orf172 domain-containing protein [Boeremia exigua]|uniref:T5orf172 domain-containing protein n=1 Tax=Boeremia exigua TaxID=749465 RepID=UPI001E8D916D|nr:T5orf172 domain-containing protein [Boeremia exigua]KAH6613055.1 T5orf172 domain-containing protein [Boeremia exigua]